MDEDNGSRLGWFVAGAMVGAGIAILSMHRNRGATRGGTSPERPKTGARQWKPAGRATMMDRGKELYDRGRKIAEDAA